jgi:hypothetical protein
MMEDLEDFVTDWVKYETRPNGICYAKDRANFVEALRELQLREEIETWEDCTPLEQTLIEGFWLVQAHKLAEEAYYDR